MPRFALCCSHWAVLVQRYFYWNVSSTLQDLRSSVTQKYRSRYALPGDLTLVVRHCWRSGSIWGRTRYGVTLWETSRHPLRNTNTTRGGDVWCSTMQRGDFDRNFDWWKESGEHRLVEPQLPFENG